MSQKNAISRTGLIVSPKKVVNNLYSKKKKSVKLNLTKCAVVKAVQYSLRPFGGLFNPFSTNCSILCNHPGPSEIKQVVKQVKEQYNEGRGTSNASVADNYLLCGDCNANQTAIDVERISGNYFHHYTDSDSRPLTPTPTMVSNRTRVNTGGSYLFQARRCHTPDPINRCTIERKQLVLDLRRSHSQDTLLRNASSEISPQAMESSVMPMHPEDVYTNSYQNRRRIWINNQNFDETSAQQQEQPKNLRLCEQAARKRSDELKELEEQKDMNSCLPTGNVCINDRSHLDDEIDGVRRRGKKKKKGKDGSTYRMNQEPETQITTIGPDSPNASARPIPLLNENSTKLVSNSSADLTSNNRENPYLRSSFINEDALKILRRGLNIDIVESAFEKFVGGSETNNKVSIFNIEYFFTDEQSIEGSTSNDSQRPD